MRKTSVILKTILLCLILLSVTLSGVAVAEDVKPPVKSTVQKSQASVVHVEDSAEFANRVDVAVKEKVLVAAQNSFDRSLGILGAAATLMGVLVGLITIVIAVAAAFGIFEGRKWRRFRNEAEKNLILIEEKLKDAEVLSQKLKDIEKEVVRERSEIKNKLPQSLNEKPSPAVEAKLDELTRRQELLELLGAKLTPEDYFARGLDAYYKERYELAIAAWDKAIELKPDYAEAWSNKGVALGKLGKNEDALKACDEAIRLKPDYANAWFNKGVALGKLGKNEDAIKACDEAIRLKPDYAVAWSNKGLALVKLGKNEDAIKAYDEAIRLKPDLAVAWFNRACCYSLNGEKANALSDLKEAIRLDKKHKDDAKTDKDFKSLLDDADFKKIVE